MFTCLLLVSGQGDTTLSGCLYEVLRAVFVLPNILVAAYSAPSLLG